MMDYSSYLPFFDQNSIALSIPVVLLTLIVGLVVSTLSKERPWPGFDVISLDEKGLSPKDSWITYGKEVLAKGRKHTAGAFQIVSGTGPKIVLPNRYVDEIKNLPQLSFNKDVRIDFFADYPGFEPFKTGTESRVVLDTIKIKLNQSLGLITDDLVDETTSSLHDILGEGREWHETLLKQNVLEMVARLSSRVFLGLPLCRNEEWLEIAKTYTVAAFMAASELREVSPILRPILHWFKPRCREARRQVRKAHELIDPEVKKRQQRVREAKAAGMKPPKTADTIGWMYEIANGKPLDFTLAQLGLTIAAIHTTTEVTTRALIDICSKPETAEALRKEVIQVIRDNGWSKVSLYKLRLMDSFIKESQRVNPMGSLSMSRYVEKKTVLSDGVVLPKGSRMSISATRYKDPEVFAEPETFDASRFLKMREIPGQENSHQAVGISANHLLFGDGLHACPGRFFVINEVKIALCQLLLKYDWRLVEGVDQPFEFHRQGQAMTNPGLKVQCKRREEEIQLDL